MFHAAEAAERGLPEFKFIRYPQAASRKAHDEIVRAYRERRAPRLRPFYPETHEHLPRRRERRAALAAKVRALAAQIQTAQPEPLPIREAAKLTGWA